MSSLKAIKHLSGRHAAGGGCLEKKFYLKSQIFEAGSVLNNYFDLFGITRDLKKEGKKI